MKKNIKQLTTIVFTCECGTEVKSDPSDTLLHETAVAEQSMAVINTDFLDMCTSDPGGLIVRANCECGLDYMTKVVVGPSSITMYICECGRRYNYDQLHAGHLEKNPR
jgi:hypothetical protein